MKTFLKFLAFIVLAITLNSCVVHEDLIYRDYYTTRHYVTYDVYPHHHHHRTVVKKKHNKPKKHYQKPQHQRPKKSQSQNRRKPSNNRNHRR